WTHSQSESSGDLARLKIAGGGVALGLIAYPNFSQYPAEVDRVDLNTMERKVVYRQSDRLVTDIASVSGEAFVAAIEAPGKLKDLPIPGKLRISRSSDLSTWTDMDVDYRAEAQRVIFAGTDRDHLWVATDTGMILKLQAAPR